MSRTLPKPVQVALTYVAGMASEMTGAGAPFEMQPKQEYISIVQSAVSEALAMLPADVLRALALRILAAEEVLDDACTRGAAAYYEAHPVSQ